MHYAFYSLVDFATMVKQYSTNIQQILYTLQGTRTFLSSEQYSITPVYLTIASRNKTERREGDKKPYFYGGVRKPLAPPP